MPGNALSPAVVDVPIGTLNQLPPDHAGPTGRMTSVYDALIRHYSSGDGAKKVLLEPRESFVSLADELRNSATGQAEAGTWASPSFLYALGDQLLSICSNRPRVFNASAWTNYGDRRVVTQKLSETVLHATNNTIAAPDHAWLPGVTCSVWTEQVFDSAGVLNTTAWIGFRSDDGAWVRVPTLLYTALGADHQYMLVKVVQDAENFWVFHNAESSGRKIFVSAYDTGGVLLATTSVHRVSPLSPGYWDVYGSFLARALLAQQNTLAVDPGDNCGVEITRFEVTGPSTITATVSHLTAAHCQGQVAWLTNDLTGTDVYLATLGPAEDTAGRLWAYEIDDDLTVTDEYDFGVFPVTPPDSITGWAAESGTANLRDVYVSWSELASEITAGGPTFDPMTRFTKTVKRTHAGVTSTIRQTNSVIQQSRAFAIDGEYHAYTYFQSGSGKTLPSDVEEYEGDGDDYFIGAPEQDVTGPGGTYGHPFALPANMAIILPSGPFSIDGGGTADKVEEITADGTTPAFVAAGTPVLKWTFKLGGFLLFGAGGILHLSAGASIAPSTNWDIIARGTSTVQYTSVVSRQGGTVTPGNFTTAGTVNIIGTVRYQVQGLANHISADVVDLFDNGTITISGAVTGGNNGAFTILPGRTSVAFQTAANPFPTLGSNLPAIWTLITTQTGDISTPVTATATVSTAQPNAWFFTGTEFFDRDIGGTLVVSDDPVAQNNGEFGVSDVIADSAITDAGDLAINVVAQLFVAPFPTVTFRIPSTEVAYTLHAAAITFDFTYIGATLSLVIPGNPRASGVYTIVSIIDSHTVQLAPTNGTTGQRSASLDSSTNIFIQRNANVQPQAQPTWFVTPLTGSQPQVGAFEKGLAYADWRYDGENAGTSDQNRYPLALSSTSSPFGTIRQVVLPFRVNTFTQVSIATVGATAVDIANVASASTIGLKVFRSQGHGEGTGDAGKLLVPGLLAAEFTASGFAENNFNVGPEAPFIVSQGEDSSTNFALTPGKTYTIQVLVTRTLENGDKVQSLPSPPVEYTLTGDNNYAVYGGRLLVPLDTSGVPVNKLYGVTNHANVSYEIYRTVVVDGVPSTQVHIITNPGNPNNLYSGSGTGSGFTFPDNFTWNYRDENPDAGIRATGPIYAGGLGQGIAPHWPAPPFSHATTWANRRWVVGYDGAVWMSAELVDGEDTWFFPGFRYPFPPEDPAVCVVGFENFLFMLCAKSVWRIPSTQLPNATLTAGAMPTPVRLPFAMGCSGFALAMADAVAYSSSVNDGRQVWAITRDLANVYLSEGIADTFNQPVSGMALDGSQRLIVAASDQTLRMFDPVPREWYLWRMSSAPTLVASYLGKPTYQDGELVLKQTDSGFIDVHGEDETPIAIDATFNSLSFAAVRAVKRLWEVQIIGERGGACNINALISYPDEVPSSMATAFGPQDISALAGSNMLLAINPAIEDSTSFVIRVFASYEDIETPGRCFSLEMLSCEVGLDSAQGLRKLPNGFRLVGR